MALKPPDAEYVLREERTVHSLLFMGDKLLAGTEDGVVSEWNLKTFRKEETVLSAGTSACMALKLLNNTLITQERKGNVNLWMPRESCWSVSKFVHLDYYGFSKIDVAEDGGGIVICPKKNSGVEMYSLKSHSKIMSFEKDDNTLGEVMALKVIHVRQEPYLLVAYESGVLHMWDFRIQRVVSYLKDENCLTAVDFSEVTMSGLYGSVSNYVVFFNIDNNCCLVRTQTKEIVNPGINSIKIRPDNRIVALGCWDGRIRLFSCKSYKLLAVLTEHSAEINDICFSTGLPVHFMAAGGKDRKISLWNIYNTSL
ncbi:guanine nucleotide-binding protein subunit beta-like protein 1 [Zootermopsis nevadensis]|uniref:Guanine nucleotide-binding protein subunit beta-like protein 1 n=1 Tax=Zootermopsis nevadensis TaxID=136037 RepID=A0A067QZJ8_ZOONE|nr:guanine nucleotide-binding protein subunit beta-like protein 1 [Zootermopsis nevadensis]KDR15858.1 Guanine nucleotide-binding protein subunit beta-like protein 1 [Zootermopsis nevadensis]